MVDQILTYVLSALGILGFLLAGRKVWWAWYVNIANQFIWLFFAIITQQWGFLLATVFYFTVFTINAVRWTKEHLMLTRNPISFVETRSDDSMEPFINVVLKGSDYSNEKYLPPKDKGPQKGPVGSPVGTSEGIDFVDLVNDESNKEKMLRFIRYEGTDGAVSNEIAYVVSDVLHASNGEDYYVKFSERYAIAHEMQRRLDVTLKGTRPDVKTKIKSALYEIDKARQLEINNRDGSGTITSASWLGIIHALGYAYGTLEDLLKGDHRVKEARSDSHARNPDRNSRGDHN